MGAHVRRLLVAGAIAVAALPVAGVGGTGIGRAQADDGFVGLAPGRLLDSRAGGQTVDSVLAGVGVRSAGSVTAVPVAGRGGVPGSAAAVALNVTVTAAGGDGYASVYPCGSEPPNASNVNFVAGQTIANAVVVKVGAEASVCVFVSAATHLIVDVGGYFLSGPGFVGLAPGRLLDSRAGGQTVDSVLAGVGVRSAGSVTAVPVAGRGGVPGSAAAVALNVTVTAAGGDGYASVYPCGSEPPNASNVNFVAGQTIANAVVVKVGAEASVCVFVSAATHLIVDVGGYFLSGPGFVGLAPGRLLDSRAGGQTVDSVLAGVGVRSAGSVTAVPVAGRGGVPGSAAAVALNVTVTAAGGDGYASVYPCGSEPPNASNVNFVAGQTIANAVVVKVGAEASVCVFVSAATHLIVDVGGWFPGSDSPPASSVPPEPIAFTEDEVFSQQSALTPYWIYVPPAYDESHQTPTTLLVWLHGCGGQGEFDIYNVSYVDGQDWISIAVGGREGACWNPDADAEKVQAAIADVKLHFNIDPKAVVLGGFSSGGDLAYRTAFYDAGSYAGVLAENTAPFRDTGSSAGQSLAAASWKFNVAHLAHTEDKTYPIATVRSEIQQMEAAGFPVTLIERPGPHYDDQTDPDLRELLLPFLQEGWRAP